MSRKDYAKLNILLALGFAASLIPILFLAFYNYPAADDFSAGKTAYWAWESTGSLREVIKAAGENVVYNYKNWSGVFASVFWTSLQPGIFGERFYGMTTVITLILLVAAGFYTGGIMGRKYLHTDRCTMSCIILIYLFSAIHLMPDGNEGLFWHAGVVNYSWAFAFLLLLAGVLLELRKEKPGPGRWLRLLLACLLAVLVGGGNYITALQGSLWLILITGFACAADGRRKSRPFFLVTAVLIFSFAISVLAPGNAVRMGSSTGMGALEAIGLSLQYGLALPLQEWLRWPVVVLLLLSLPLMWRATEKVKFNFPYPIAVAVLAYCLVSAGFTPSLYAQGAMEAGRLRNTVYFLWLLAVYLVSFYVMGWSRKRFEKKRKKASFKQEKLLVWGLFLLFTAGSVFYLGAVDRELYIGTAAAKSLLKGQAGTYRQENEERLQLLRDSDEQNVVVRPFSDPPELLLFQELSSDPNEWINTAVAQYYKKESVRVEY